jgi:hypothetical protein
MNESRIKLDGKSLITPEVMARGVMPPHLPSHSDQLATATAELGLVLHTAQQWFQEGRDPAKTMRWTVQSLHKIRSGYELGVWRSLIPLAQEHPVAGFFLQDPFTRWSFEKPRGYSGDAKLIDFIYQHETVAEDVSAASPIGRALYDYTELYPSCVAVRERRDLLKQMVDQIAVESEREIDVLAVAAGHLREADRSTALRTGRIKRWIALDQDPLSVGSIARDFHGTRVEAFRPAWPSWMPIFA